MTDQEKIVTAGLILGLVLSTVGLTVALGAGWAALWAGILFIAGALKLDAG